MPSSRLTKHFFEDTAELWQFLLRPEARERGFTRNKVKKIILAIEVGWAIARTLQVLRVALRVLPILERLPRVESIPRERLEDAALQRLEQEVRDLAPLIRGVHGQIVRAQEGPVRLQQLVDALDERPSIRRRQRSLASDVQIMAAFAVRSASRLGIRTIEPVEMESMVVLAGLRDQTAGPDFGPDAPRRTRRRANWRAALAKAPDVLVWIDSLWEEQRT